MNQELRIEPLALNRQALPLLRSWFEAEWPAWYGPGGQGDAGSDLAGFANRGSLPTGVVAFRDGQLCAVAALKAESIASHRHLSPWAAAGYVHPSLRGQGIGAQLLAALEHEAARLGFGQIYCATSSAQSLLQRCGWQLLERTRHDGKELGIYCKALLSALATEDFLELRAKRGSREKFDAVLAKVPDVVPETRDRK